MDIQCFSETNLDTQQRAVRETLKTSVQQADSKAKSTWCSSQIPATTYFKPGGTAMITTGRLASKVKSMGSDSMGRWCYHLLEGKASVDLLVVSIYQSCTQHGTDDGMTFHTQQRLMLSQMDRPTFDPRPNFFIDLKHFLHQHVNTASTPTIPIILGDWNEECTGTSTSQKLCDSFGLVDLWKFCNPSL